MREFVLFRLAKRWLWVDLIKTFNYLKHSYKDDEDKFLSAVSHEVSSGSEH